MPAGRHVRDPLKTSMLNPFTARLDRAGVPVDSVGDSTGKLGYLSDL